MSEPAIGLKNALGNSSQGNEYPSRLFVETTTRCNLRCGMCVKQNGDGGVPEGSISSGIFEALEPAFPHLEALVLNGIGEPLLHPCLDDLISMAKKKMPATAWIGFQSNGILLDEKRAVSLIDAGLDRICLSVDAVTQDMFRRIREGGEMSDVERAFASLNEAKTACGRQDFETGIEFVLMRRNLFELPDALRWASRHGTGFALVTQLLPYEKSLIDQSVYDTNTYDAISVYEQWKKQAEKEGIKIMHYFDTFMKYYKTSEEEKIFSAVEQMKNDAVSRDIALHVERLFKRDEAWFRRVDEVFEEARHVAEQEGINVKLPEMAPKNNRRCEFVESDGAFVSWSGDVHPCYFLWHRYRCYVGGWEKAVKPWVFGNLSDRDIIDIWNLPDYRSFRQRVLQYDFPFCFDCSFALCDLAQRDDFEQDCYTNRVPCGACLWCTGLFHCLQ